MDISNIPAEDTRMIYLNQTTATIIQAYLQYAGDVVKASLEKQGYSGTVFKEIDDDLIIKPYELTELIDEVQRALVDAL